MYVWSILTTPVTFTCDQKDQIKEKIDFTVFEKDPEFGIVDVKDCLAGLKYDNEWNALLTVEPEKPVTERISNPADDGTISSCEDEFECKSNKDGIQISQKHQLCQTFYKTWVKKVLNEWKEKPVSNITCSYGYKSCALGCGSNILEIGDNEEAAIKRHFSEVDLVLRGKCPNTELIVNAVNLHIQSECRKIRTRNNSVFGHFSRNEIL